MNGQQITGLVLFLLTAAITIYFMITSIADDNDQQELRDEINDLHARLDDDHDY